MINPTSTAISALPAPTRPPFSSGVARSAAAIGAVDAFFDLSAGRRGLFGTIDGLHGEELDSFLKMTANLLQAGIVGIETLDIDGRPYQSFISTRAAAPELRGIPPYIDRRPTDSRLDIRT